MQVHHYCKVQHLTCYSLALVGLYILKEMNY
jgi:hypothetical protein